MNDMYMKLTDILEDEISKIVKDGEVTQTSLCNLDTLVDVIKDIQEITSRKEYDSEYSSRRMMYNDGYSGRNSYGRENTSNYNRGSSYDDWNDNMRTSDRYMRYEGDLHYSGDGEKEKMISLMEEAMRHASTKEEKDEIMKMIQKMDK